MPVYHSTDEVASAISPKGLQVIAIDGFQASGKTTLARSLAAHWNLNIISADDFLHRNQGGFFANLKLKELSDHLRKANTPYIFEGLCALQILDAVKVQPDLMIYVKRMTDHGWADGMALDTYMPSSDDCVLPTQNFVEPLDLMKVILRTLWEEVAHYHKSYQPHKNASIFFERYAASISPLEQ
ncbi:hypothetical protein J0667_17445 [Methylomonas sp. WH-1]|uniref:hypothetical protein n=1 Tax=unclassified Methylomonas TaxID=2608980 RepID=UPI00101FAA7C|nr:hypothetical protein [Methylomonas sp. LW13]